MGYDVSEDYAFVGPAALVQKLHGELSLFDEVWDESARKMRFVHPNPPAKSLAEYIEEKYPVDIASTKQKDYFVGWDANASEVKTAGGLAYFKFYLSNYSRYSDETFRLVLEKYFPGVFFYYLIALEPGMENRFYTNDKAGRFFPCPRLGELMLFRDWNVGVLYDGSYSKEEIINAYKLYLGNPNIDGQRLPIFTDEDEPLSDDMFTVEDNQVNGGGFAEPTVAECFALQGRSLEKEKTLHGMRTEWQNVSPIRPIDYDKYPDLKNSPHWYGVRPDGTPFLFYAGSDYSMEDIPPCITDIDPGAFR